MGKPAAPNPRLGRLAVLGLALSGGLASGTAVKKWQILGPFVVGKNELDGEAWRLSNASELLASSARWKRFTASAGGTVQVQWPEVEWQSLVNGVGGQELLEWQAEAKAAFKTDGSDVRISCQGVPSFLVDDGNFRLVGDLYWAKLPAHTVKLPAGLHRISIRLRGKLQTQFNCNVEKLSAKVLALFGDSFAALPDLIRWQQQLWIAGDIAVGLANQDPTRWLKNLRPVLKRAAGSPFLSLAPLAPQPDSSSLAPGQMTRVAVRLEVQADAVCKDEISLDLAFEGQVGSEWIQSDPLRLRLKCRDAERQSFVFTFQDVDGSIQHAAAVLPQPPTSCDGGACPVVVTLSGTSITARDSADAYKMKSKDSDPEYRFGIEGAWLLAPTRHGAHNWEGPGRATALAALSALPALASRLGVAADAARTVVAGHSMGGHGAWLFAFARDVLAVISSASWLRKDQYADSNKVLLHDVATSSVEPLLQALLRQAEADFDVEAQVATVAHLPVLIRVGSQDRTVHPWFSRRIYRTLLSHGAQDVRLSELPGKEHWWWDTNAPNDGGAVNDPEIRQFLKRVLSKDLPPTKHWRLVVAGGATSTVRGGLRLQPGRPERRAEVAVDLVPQGPARLRTVNVEHLHWTRSKEWEAVDEVLLDGQLQRLPAQEASWCLSHGTWQSCRGPHQPRRQRSQAGPMREIFSAPLCGVSADQEGEAALQFFANMFVMTGHGAIRLLQMEEVKIRGATVSTPAACEHLLVVGPPETPVVAALLAGSPISSSNSSLSLGSCSWKRGDTLAALALLPWWKDGEGRLALVATGGSRSAAEALMMLSTPTIPPMARQPLTHLLPDYVVLDVEETRGHGPGGYLAAGFWGNDWEMLPSAYERCDVLPSASRSHALGSAAQEL